MPLASLSRHDGVVARAAPHFAEWSALHGRVFVFWFGTRPRLAVADPHLVKAVVADGSGNFEKVEFNPSAKQLFGEGLVGLKGERWAVHRRVIAPAFNLERLKVCPI